MADGLKDRIIARRYADAYVGYVKESMGLENCVKEMKNLFGILREHQELGQFLKSPQIGYSAKIEIIDKIFADNFSQELRQFLKFLLDKRRIDKIADIADYIRIKYSHGEAVTALLRTSSILDLDLIERIKTKLEKQLNKKVNLYLELDANLLGGVQVVIGNTIIDGSSRRRIEDIKERLLNIEVA